MKTTTTDVSGNSAPRTMDPARTGKVHSKVYRDSIAEKNSDNTKHSYDILSSPRPAKSELSRQK